MAPPPLLPPLRDHARQCQRDVAIGSKRSPSSSAISAACSAGDTVMALPLSPRLNGAAIGTFDMAKPEARGDRHRRQQMGGIEQPDIEEVAGRSDRGHLSHQGGRRGLGPPGKTLSTAMIGAAASTRGMNPMRKGRSFQAAPTPLRIDFCAISPIFFSRASRSSTSAHRPPPAVSFPS